VILVDALQRGGAPGTVYLIKPDLESLAASDGSVVNAHSLDPVRVVQLASSMGAKLDRVLLVACEPAELGGEQGQLGLSPLVEASIETAVQKIESVIAEIEQGQWPLS
jgi:hydrogenase maturation protease